MATTTTTHHTGPWDADLDSPITPSESAEALHQAAMDVCYELSSARKFGPGAESLVLKAHDEWERLLAAAMEGGPR